jgi:chorismate synthase
MDTPFDMANVSEKELLALSDSNFSVIENGAEARLRAEVSAAAEKGDSIGGILEIAVTGIKGGVGSPMFDGVENALAKAVFGIPAVKGIEFGAGFSFANMLGSQANDQMYMEKGTVKCKTNNNGGITGGITNGMPIVFRVAIKPTPSISVKQDTVDLLEKCNTELSIKGRHDPCIVPRALPAIEAITAIAIANLL